MSINLSVNLHEKAESRRAAGLSDKFLWTFEKNFDLPSTDATRFIIEREKINAGLVERERERILFQWNWNVIRKAANFHGFRVKFLSENVYKTSEIQIMPFMKRFSDVILYFKLYRSKFIDQLVFVRLCERI